MDNITELDNKYLVMKWDDVRDNLNSSQRRELISIVQHNNKCRENEGKKDNDYIVLNMDDKIDLGHWSQILDKIKEIQNSHNILIKENKSKTRREYRHDGRPDYVKEIAVTLVNAIIKAENRK
jgi:hypothetical protein